jgi:enoyl-CoA hydratase/carnithine racemase
VGSVNRLDVDFADGVCFATLSEPEKLNPLGEQIRRQLHDLVRQLSDDTATRVLVLAGAGRSFSVGADLRETELWAGGEPGRQAEQSASPWAMRRRNAGGWQRLLDDLERLPQVTVGRLQGPVIGGAVILAAACDIRVAATDLTLTVPELAVGVPLQWAGLPRLVREIGLPRTRELVMTGRSIDAETALAWGFVHRLTDPPNLDTLLHQVVGELVAMPDAPLRITKDAMTALGREHPTHATAWADADLFMWASQEAEAQRAIGDYVQARLNRPRDDS